MVNLPSTVSSFVYRTKPEEVVLVDLGFNDKDTVRYNRQRQRVLWCPKRLEIGLNIYPSFKDEVSKIVDQKEVD